MDAHFWVYLSTILFLIGIFILAKKTIISSLDNKRQEIRALLDDTKAKRQEAQALYDSFMKKMDNLEKQTAEILTQAEESANQMLQDAEREVENLIKFKKSELEKRLSNYEEMVKNKVISEYADAYIALVNEKLEKKPEIKPLDFLELTKVH